LSLLVELLEEHPLFLIQHMVVDVVGVVQIIVEHMPRR
jgi:hypothetical protein